MTTVTAACYDKPTALRGAVDDEAEQCTAVMRVFTAGTAGVALPDALA